MPFRNHFGGLVSMGERIHPILNRDWLLTYAQVSYFNDVYQHYGSPSKLYKYGDYGALHYVFYDVEPVTSVTSLHEYVWFFFPGDAEMSFRKGVGVSKRSLAPVSEQISSLEIEEWADSKPPEDSVLYTQGRRMERAQKIQYTDTGKAQVSPPSRARHDSPETIRGISSVNYFFDDVAFFGSLLD